MDRVHNIYQFVTIEGKSDWERQPTVKINSANDTISYNFNCSLSTVIISISKISDLIIGSISSGIHDIAGTKICFDYNNDSMELVFMKPMRYRRCTIYPVIQFNHKTKKIRITVWGSDYILHSGQSFGTSLNDVSDNKIIEYIRNDVSEYHLVDTNISKRLHEHDYILFIDRVI